MPENKRTEQKKGVRNITYTPTAVKSYEMGVRSLLQCSFDEAKMFFEECLGEDRNYCEAWAGLISAKLEDADVYRYIVSGEGSVVQDSVEDKIALSAKDIVMGNVRYDVKGTEKNKIAQCTEDIKNALNCAISDDGTTERIVIFVCEVLGDIIDCKAKNDSFVSLYRSVVVLRNLSVVVALNAKIENHLAELYTSQANDFDSIVDLLLPAVDGVHKKTQILNDVITCYLDGDIEKAKTWNKRLHDINPDNVDCALRSLFFACGVYDGELKWKNFDFALWKELLAACDDSERVKHIKEWCDKCVDSVENAQLGIAAKSKIKACLAVFDELISTEPLYNKIWAMADACLRRGLFDEATLYYSMLLDDKSRKEHIARFGILLARFKCKSEQEFLFCKEFDIYCPEYKQLLISCGDDDAALKRYTNMAKRQKENIAAAQCEPEKPAKQKAEHDTERNMNIALLVTLGLSLASLLFGIIAWIALQELMPYYAGLVIAPFVLSFAFAIIVVALIIYKLKQSSKAILVAKRVAIAMIALSVPLIIASSIVAPVTKEYDGYQNGVFYNMVGDRVEIAECRDKDVTTVNIGKDVTDIGAYAFANCSKLTSVTISDSVTDIGAYAFANCSKLTSVTISDSVTDIGFCAFEDCSSLTSITIPDSVTSISYGAFSGCSSLTSITIPSSVTYISGSAFSGCSRLKTVYWNATKCVSAGSSYYPIFKNCWSLTSVVIGNNVTTIPSYAFYGRSKLTSITIPNSVTSIGGGAFASCSSLTSITIPSSVTHIGDSAFYSCSKLTSITIPNSVNTIGYQAFGDCTNLTIYAEAQSKPYGWASNWNGSCDVVWGYVADDN